MNTMKSIVAAAGLSAAVGTWPALAICAEDNPKVRLLSTEFSARNVFASGWIGSYVFHPETGDAIGEVRDLVLTADGRTVSHAVMDVGASLGIGETLVVVPLSQIETVAEGGQRRFLSDISKSDLIEAATP